jgi:hypothetical protein
MTSSVWVATEVAMEAAGARLDGCPSIAVCGREGKRWIEVVTGQKENDCAFTLRNHRQAHAFRYNYDRHHQKSLCRFNGVLEWQTGLDRF